MVCPGRCGVSLRPAHRLAPFHPLPTLMSPHAEQVAGIRSPSAPCESPKTRSLHSGGAPFRGGGRHLHPSPPRGRESPLRVALESKNDRIRELDETVAMQAAQLAAMQQMLQV